MSGKSALFASARVKYREGKLITTERLNRMTEAETAEDVLRVLFETAYAEGTMITDPRQYEVILNAEINNLTSFFAEVCPDKNIASFFLIPYDYQNAKTLVKAKYGKIQDYSSMLFENGLINIKQLEENITGDNYTFLPAQMTIALKKIDMYYASYGINPAYFDSELNKAMYEDLNSLADLTGGDIKSYFILKADIENLLTAVKCRLAGLNSSELEKQFVTGGGVNLKAFEGVINAAADTAAESLRHTSISFLAAKTLKDITEQGIAPLEREADNMLNLYFYDKRNMTGTLYPLINYYLIKLAEIKNINMIFTGKLGGADSTEIKKRLKSI